MGNSHIGISHSVPVRLLAMLIGASLLAACNAATTKTNARWGQHWDHRLNQYAENVSALETDLTETYEAFNEAATRPASDRGENELVETYTEIAGQEYELSQAYGQQLVLQQFGQYLQTQPTPRMTTTWIEDRANKLTAAGDEADAQKDEFWRRFNEDEDEFGDWPTAYLEVARKQGLIAGAADELVRLSNEYTAYQADLADAKQADRARQQRFALAMQAFGQQMQQHAYQQQQLLYQQQLLNAVNRPITCNSFGTMTTCY